MVTVESYISNTIKLIKSLTIKSIDTAIHINNELVKIYGTSILGSDKDDRTQWKYFMNLTGLYHIIDNPIKIITIEDNVVKQLTKEMLLDHPTTKVELNKYSDYYLDLVNNHPGDELLIKGIISDIDMDTLLNADDGSIVSYSYSLVEDQETNLIHELSTYSTNFFLRWHIREYGLVDNLYIPALLSTLYSKLFLKALNIRYSNIYTSNIHSFHMFEFFRSHFDIDITVLNKNTKFWLYKNMKYIRKHIGSNETLNLIIEKILTNNGIGVAEIELISSLPDVNLLTATDLTRPIYDAKIQEFVSNPRNNYYLNTSSDILTSKNMLLLQFNNDLVDNDLVIKDPDFYDDRLDEILDRNYLHRQKTKTFKLKVNKSNILVEEITMKILLDNWVHTAFNNTYRTNANYIDPNTGYVYNINPKQGVLVVLKILSIMSGYDNPIIKGYNARELINYDIDTIGLIKGLISYKELNSLSNKVINLRPENLVYLDSVSFKEYLNKINILKTTMWNIASNTNDMIYSSEINVMYNRLRKREYVIFNNGDSTIDELLNNENIDFKFNIGYDYEETLSNLFSLFTGYRINNEDVKKMIDDYIDITKKLSSYTIQFIDNTKDSNLVNLKYHDLQSTNKGIIDLKEATFNSLEEFYGFIKAKGITYGTYLATEKELIEANGVTNKTPPEIIMYSKNNIDTIKADVGFNLIVSNSSYVNIFKPVIDNKVVNMDESLFSMDKDTLQGTSKYEALKVTIYEDSDNINEPNIIGSTDTNPNLYKPTINNLIVNEEINVSNESTIQGTVNNDITNLIGYEDHNDINLISSNDTSVELFKPNIDNVTVNDNITHVKTEDNITVIKGSEFDTLIYDNNSLSSNEPTIIVDNNADVNEDTT